MEAAWSIVTVDPVTAEVGLAGATCNLGIHFTAAASPGVGVVSAIAETSFKGRNQAFEWMEAGIDAEEILKRLSDPWTMTRQSPFIY